MLFLRKNMNMGSSSYLAFFFLPLLAFFLVVFADGEGTVGINYGRIANNLPTPEKVVELLKSQGINKIKIYDTDAAVLTALADSGISVVVALPNELLKSTATDQSFADNWVKSNISQYYPSTRIEAIAVGNEVFVDPSNTTSYLVQAMKNVHNALVKFNHSEIKVSSPVALSALQNSYPPSSGSFKEELIPVIKGMLDFFQKTGSYLMINAYPFFAYSGNTKEISLDYTLFKENPGVVDSNTGLKYYSLLDAELDAVHSAMSALHAGNVSVVVTETGWPSIGDEDEVGASAENAASYNGNLVKRVLTGGGTPLRPKEPLNVYLFALFNENAKPGPTSERNYGLFYPDEKKVYDMPLMTSKFKNDHSSSKLKNGRSSVHKTESRTQVNPQAINPTSEEKTSSYGQTWCVANKEVGDEKLQTALDYACGEGQADCRPIQPDATCYNPNSLVAHASYAFNSYYQKKARAAGTCHFGGAAYVVTQPPSFGTCHFPTGY